MRMELDTGSAVSAISNDLFLRMFSHIPLCQPDINLVSYAGSCIVPLGYAIINVCYNDKKFSLKFFVIEGGPRFYVKIWVNYKRNEAYVYKF